MQRERVRTSRTVILPSCSGTKERAFSIRLVTIWPMRRSWPLTTKRVLTPGLRSMANSICPSSCGCGFARYVDEVAQQDFQIDRSCIHPRQLGIETRGVGDIADQAVEAANVVLDDIQQPLLRIVRFGEWQRLDGAAQRRQRVLQFVADVGRKAFDRIDTVVERRCHLAQRN